MLTPGSKIGPYEILERLGAGGMGEVYRARDPRLSRHVAIKVLGRSLLGNETSLRRFLHEAQAASALNHPNILTVHEIGQADEGPYLVTEFVDGETVREALRRGPLPIDRALDVAIDVCRGLAKAHAAGFVHRDIKPENVMVTRDGHAKILDFGLAKAVPGGAAEPGVSVAALTSSGAILGTPAYISPEQLTGKPADARSDVYALALLLYEMITGVQPFLRSTIAETLQAILRESPPRLDETSPGTPPTIAALVARCLDRDPTVRPPSAGPLLGELTRTPGSGHTPVEATNAPPSRWRSLFVPLAAGAVAVTALIATSLYFIERTSQPASGTRAPTEDASPTFLANQGRKVLAVMPIRNESREANRSNANLGEILADALVQVLGDQAELYVASTARIEAALKTLGNPAASPDHDAYARRLGRAVSADLVLTGELSGDDRAYRIDAALLDLASGTTDSFAAESRNPERMLDDLVSGIAAEVGRRFEVAQIESLPRLEEVATGSVAAYAHFVRGMNYTYAGEWSEAVPQLQQAVAIDPQMGIAWTELACAYSFAGDEARSIAAQREAERLLSRVNRKERMWIELNGIWINTGNGPAYLKAARAFVEAFPDEREGYFYAGLGAEHLLQDCRAAIRWYERAYELTPIFYPITKGLADCHLKLGQRDRAVSSLRRYLRLGATGTHGRSEATSYLTRLDTEGG